MKKELIILIMVFMAVLCQGATITVSQDGTGDYTTIQAAIEAAIDGDEVVVSDGIYTGEGNRDILIHGKSLTVKSQNGPGNCIIYYDGDEDERVEYIFNIYDVEAKSVIIDGIAIISSNVYSAIGCWSGGHTIKDCIFINDGIVDDIYWAGGAVGCYFSHDELIKIKGCSFVSCSSWVGAGIFCEASTVLVEDCLFLDNNSYDGGVIYCITEGGASDMTVKNCNFSGNESFGDGGAVYCGRDSEIKLIDCTFNDNQAYYSGGAFYCRGIGTVENCRMLNNTADNGGAISTGLYGNIVVSRSVIKRNEAVAGGGVSVREDSKCFIDNCLITDNLSDYRGGGVRAQADTTLVITDSTISNNTADQGGGLFILFNSICAVGNSIIWGNNADEGAQVFSLDLSIWLSNCDVRNVEGVDIEGIVEMEECIHEEPLFTGPDDYTLQGVSPCIDAGANEHLTGYSDVAGQYRPLDGDLDGMATTDIGAYEFCPEGKSVIQCSERYVSFTYFINNPTAQEQTITVRNSGEGLLNWSIIEDIPWLYAEPVTGTADADGIEVVLSAYPASLVEGVYSGKLGIVDPEALNNPFEIDVYLSVVGDGLWVPYNYPTIQEAIYEAEDGQTVFVADGVYTGQGNRDIRFLGKEITVRSVRGAENCIIDCQCRDYDRHAGFCFESGEDENSILDGFTVIGAYPRAINCRLSKPTIRNCVFRDSPAVGISCSEGGAIIDNCRFIRNFPDYAGVIEVREATEPVRVSNCTFLYNRSVFGSGAVWFSGESITITDSIMKFNRSSGWGGTVYIVEGTAFIERCIIENNTNWPDGGGVYCLGPDLTVKDCSIRGNRSGRGGGIFARYGNIQILGSKICDNEALEWQFVPLGGGIFCASCEVLISGCEITGNYSQQSAGGVLLRKSSGKIRNSIIAGNKCKYDGGGISIDHEIGDIEIEGCTIVENISLENPSGGFANLTTEGTINMTNCILYNNTPEQIISSLDNLAVEYCDIQAGWEGIGNINEEPLFMEPGYWDDNDMPDDPTDDVWIKGDYHLLVSSPCIDAGDPEYPTYPPDVDLDGLLRVVDGDLDNIARVDMGCYEYQPPVPVEVKITPSALDVNSHGRYVVAHIQMPEDLVVSEEDIETILLDGQIEAEDILIGEDKMITSRFNRTAVSDYLIDSGLLGPVELTITCILTDRTVFEGKDTINIKK